MAGRIPQSFINSLLDRVDILAVVGERVQLKRKGNSYWGCCPFHDEKSPSFHVLPERQFYKCFGCGVSGTALSFVMAYERLEFVEAIERLAASCGLEVPREAGGDPAVDREREQLLAVVAAVAEHFQKSLAMPSGAQARAYLAKRGIGEATVARFGIGHAPAGWDGLQRAFPQYDVALLERAGLLARNERGVYDRFRDRLMFPIRNSRGRVIGFGGRVMDGGEPKYLNSPESPIFSKGREIYGLHEARRSGLRDGRLVLVEGYMDVVGLAQHGIDNGVAALGTATSTQQLETLLRSAPELVCCFDADKAGDAAAWKALENALPVLTDDRRLSFVRLPQGEDPDSLVLKGGRDAWDGIIAGRMPFADWFFERLSDGLQLQGVDDRTALVRRAEPLLARLPAGVRQKLMRERVRELAGFAAPAPRARMPGTRNDAGQAAWHPAREQPGDSALRGGGEIAMDDVPWPDDGLMGGPPADDGWRDPGDGFAPPRAAAGSPWPGARRPAGRRPATAQPSGTAGGSLALRVLTFLVKSPEMARAHDLGWLCSADAEGDPTFALLVEVAQALHEHPAADVGYLLGYFHGHPRQAELQRIGALRPPVPESAWAGELAAALADLARGRGRRRGRTRIDSEEALRAQFEARRRREHEAGEP
jgi:DNA primase